MDFIVEAYRKHSRKLHDIAQAVLKNKDDADDILQAMFERIVKNPNAYLAARNLEAMLSVATHRMALNALEARDAKNRAGYNHYMVDKESNVEYYYYQDVLYRFILRSLPQQRAVLESILACMSQKEIALQLNIKAERVKFVAKQAYKACRRYEHKQKK
jgi:RNA polymerase sigma factor (sigma-70 family)